MAYESPIQFETKVDKMIFKMQEDFEHSVAENLTCEAQKYSTERVTLVRKKKKGC